ncbi:hypothetical protein B0H19DRAFT_1258960 [Mycena capillaripes]|nr:hypothetical protein B0H19DRAFT_1258960 [Mycena capillaripes]
MGGTIYAFGPNQTFEDDYDDLVYVCYSYRGFTAFKGIVLRGAIAFLTALSGKEISKQKLIDEAIVLSEKVEAFEETIVIANYRARIDAAISLLKGWVRTPKEDPSSISSNFGPGPSSGNPRLGPGILSFLATLEARREHPLAALLPDMPIQFDVIESDSHKYVPHTLTELRLEGLHTLVRYRAVMDQGLILRSSSIPVNFLQHMHLLSRRP